MKKPLWILACAVSAVGIAGCSSSPDQSTSNGNNDSSPPVAAAPYNNGAPYNNSTADNNAITSSAVTPPATQPATQPDNTAINARDNTPGAVTAGMQGQSKPDIDVTADIRRQIMQQNFSINAQNVKIITQDGKVTLRGPVASQDEKDAIGRIAISCAGADNVDNQLDVQP